MTTSDPWPSNSKLRENRWESLSKRSFLGTICGDSEATGGDGARATFTSKELTDVTSAAGWGPHSENHGAAWSHAGCINKTARSQVGRTGDGGE